MENFVVILRIPSTKDEAEKAMRGEVDYGVLMPRRSHTLLAAVRESDFAAVANLQRLPDPPESARG